MPSQPYPDPNGLVSGIRLQMMELSCNGHPMLTCTLSHSISISWQCTTTGLTKLKKIHAAGWENTNCQQQFDTLTEDGKSQQLTRSTSSSTVNVKSYMRARSWYYTRAAFVDTQELQYIIQESENRWARTDASGHKWTKPFTASVSTRLVAIRIAEIDFLMHWTSGAWRVSLQKTNSTEKLILLEDWSKPCIPQIRSS